MDETVTNVWTGYLLIFSGVFVVTLFGVTAWLLILAHDILWPKLKHWRRHYRGTTYQSADVD